VNSWGLLRCLVGILLMGLLVSPKMVIAQHAPLSDRSDDCIDNRKIDDDSKMNRFIIADRKANGADVLKIRRLKSEKGLTVSARAAWEEVRRIVPSEAFNVPIAIDSARLQRFVGFLEGRMPVSLPMWWEQSVAEARAFSRSVFVFSNESFRKRGVEGPWGIASRNEGVFVFKEEHVQLVVGDEKVSLSEPVANYVQSVTNRNSGLQLSAAITDTDYYLGLHSIRYGFRVIRVDRKSGLIARCYQVAGDGWKGIPRIELFSSHLGAIRANDDVVVIFGLTANSAYLEGFDRVSGKSLFWFSTALAGISKGNS